MRAIWINAKEGKVELIEIDPKKSLKELQERVEGYIELALQFENGDDLYVNEEGIIQQIPYGFTFSSKEHNIEALFFGNGIICGHNPKTGDTVAAVGRLLEIKQQVRFIHRQDEGQISLDLH